MTHKREKSNVDSKWNTVNTHSKVGNGTCLHSLGLFILIPAMKYSFQNQMSVKCKSLKMLCQQLITPEESRPIHTFTK